MKTAHQPTALLAYSCTFSVCWISISGFLRDLGNVCRHLRALQAAIRDIPLDNLEVDPKMLNELLAILRTKQNVKLLSGRACISVLHSGSSYKIS